MPAFFNARNARARLITVRYGTVSAAPLAAFAAAAVNPAARRRGAITHARPRHRPPADTRRGYADRSRHQARAVRAGLQWYQAASPANARASPPSRAQQRPDGASLRSARLIGMRPRQSGAHSRTRQDAKTRASAHPAAPGRTTLH